MGEGDNETNLWKIYLSNSATYVTIKYFFFEAAIVFSPGGMLSLNKNPPWVGSTLENVASVLRPQIPLFPTAILLFSKSSYEIKSRQTDSLCFWWQLKGRKKELKAKTE